MVWFSSPLPPPTTTTTTPTTPQPISHSHPRRRQVSGNFVYFRMNRIVDIYFVGGFGTVQWIAPDEYLASTPDEIVLNNPNNILTVLNEQFAPVLRAKLGTAARPLDELMFISIDASGVDIRARTGPEFSVERIGFPTKVRAWSA